MNDLEDLCFCVFEVLPLAILLITVSIVGIIIISPFALLWWIFTGRNLFRSLNL